MDVDRLGKEMDRFLISPEPEILCITGEWGVGKTFAWNLARTRCQETRSIALNKYSYVSLFGQNSLEDVRTTIIENTTNSNDRFARPDFSSLSILLSSLQTSSSLLSKFSKLLPGTTNYTISANRALFFFLNRQIVCFDDIERAGSQLTVQNVFGLANLLKEEKQCKVVLLLNKETLVGDNACVFSNQVEKLADKIFSFSPSTAQAAQIGVPLDTPRRDEIIRHIELLQITNIRTIKRIIRLNEELLNALDQADERIYAQAVQTLTIAVYARFDKTSKISLEWLMSYSPYKRLFNKAEQIDDLESIRRTSFSAFGMTNIDDFDRLIMISVRDGYFDKEALRSQTKLVETTLLKTDSDISLREAWRAFHDSLRNDDKEALDKILNATVKNISAVTPLNLNGTIRLLKEFNRSDDAANLIQLYVNCRNEPNEFWNLNNSAFRGDIDDPDIKLAFSQKYKENVDKPDPTDLLISIGERGGWNSDEIAYASQLRKDELIKILQSRVGEDFRSIIQAVLLFKDIGNPTEDMRAFNETVRLAVTQIAAESKMNEKRVRNLGFELDPQSS